jgi:hypothetical protein
LFRLRGRRNHSVWCCHHSCRWISPRPKNHWPLSGPNLRGQGGMGVCNSMHATATALSTKHPDLSTSSIISEKCGFVPFYKHSFTPASAFLGNFHPASIRYALPTVRCPLALLLHTVHAAIPSCQCCTLTTVRRSRTTAARPTVRPPRATAAYLTVRCPRITAAKCSWYGVLVPLPHSLRSPRSPLLHGAVVSQ